MAEYSRSGFLGKETGGLFSGTVHQRWFILSGERRTLEWLKKPSSTKASGVISLDNCTVRNNDAKKHKFCFEIAHETRRTFYLYASDALSRDQWAQAILVTQSQKTDPNAVH